MRFSASVFRSSTALATALVVLAVSMPELAFAAKRLGGGGSIGRQQSGITQRQAAPAPKPATPGAAPAQQAAPAGAAGTPATPAAAPGGAAAPAGAAASPAAAQRPAAGAQTPATPAPQQPARNRWLGPLAGLAAGIGLAALFSHFGLGDELASFMGSFLMIALLAFAAIFIFRMLTRSRQQPAARSNDMAYAGAGQTDPSDPQGGAWQQQKTAFEPQPAQRTAPSFTGSAAPLGAELNVYGQPVGGMPSQAGFEVPAADAPLIDLPDGFDTTGFLRAARGVFIKLQAANDAGDVVTLREFVSDDLLTHFQDDIQRRAGAAQLTEVVALETELVAFERDWDEHIASVLFTGSIRETAGAPAEGFQEIWNLSRPVRQAGGWTLVGIQSV